nr:hypothetical protein [Lacticaseibacillus manihotivorans]
MSKAAKKEIISRGGEKVAPAHVESVLSELPFIEQQAVIGMPDDLYGEEVTAVLVSTTPGSMKPNNAKKSWISAAATWRNLKHPLASNSSVNFHATPLVKSYVRNCGNNYFL